MEEELLNFKIYYCLKLFYNVNKIILGFFCDNSLIEGCSYSNDEIYKCPKDGNFFSYL
jgi:hypothetical protein